MTKLKEYKLSIIIISLTILIVIVSMVLIDRALTPYYRPDKEQIEKYFKRDRDDLTLIADYFSKYSDSFSFDSFDFKARNYHSIIENDEVVGAITRLFREDGYSVIGKNNNTIYFQKWTRGTDFSVGIAYSINETDDVDLEFLTKRESLSDEGWYYYETDYNELR